MTENKVTVVRCDALGCDESYPVKHEQETEEGYRFGKWLGWVYLDVNRPDILDRSLRFCDVRCLTWWLQHETMTRKGWQFTEAPVDIKESAIRRIAKVSSQ